MPQRVFSFVVVLVLYFNVEIFSQIKSQYVKLPINYSTLANFEFEKKLQPGYLAKLSTFSPEKIKRDLGIITSFQPLLVLSKPALSPSFYSHHLGFFCKKELQLEKIISVPFRFRLGSLDYVNYLEQKPNAQKQ
jgi:hypothetical protein